MCRNVHPVFRVIKCDIGISDRMEIGHEKRADFDRDRRAG